jgi:hypothetical protein
MHSSHYLSRSIDLRRSGPANPTNDPHYHSYKLIHEPPPPPPLPPQQQDPYPPMEDDIEEVDLEDTEDIISNGSKEEVLFKLNQKMNALQKSSKKMSLDLYGEGKHEHNAQNYSSTADGMLLLSPPLLLLFIPFSPLLLPFLPFSPPFSPPLLLPFSSLFFSLFFLPSPFSSSVLTHKKEIYKNTGGIWDAEILDHLDEMKEAQTQRVKGLQQSWQDSRTNAPLTARYKR